MGKMPLYTMLQKACSAGGWTMVAQLEAMPRGASCFCWRAGLCGRGETAPYCCST